MAEQPRSSSTLSPRERARSIGRRAGVVVFATIFSAATLWWTFQILTAVWGGAAPSPDGCALGTAKLESAIGTARRAYLDLAGDADERMALKNYRTALEPAWSARKSVEAACRGDAAGARRLKDVIALRYAEEHAVRYESLGLAPLRRRLKGTRPSPMNELNR
jgi:hypothetical protein